MPLFSFQIKIMNITLIITISIVVVLYLIVAMAYSVKVDDVLYNEYPKMPNKEKERICFYTFFWFIFFNKLEKIIQGKK